MCTCVPFHRPASEYTDGAVSPFTFKMRRNACTSGFEIPAGFQIPSTLLFVITAGLVYPIYCAGAQRWRFLFRNWSFKRSSVRPSVRCTSGKNEQNTQNMCAGFKDLLFAVFDQSIFKVPKKKCGCSVKE